jgi:hypothetical protein
MFSVINRLRLAVSGLSLMAGSGHNTESFLVDVCLEGGILSLAGSAEGTLSFGLLHDSVDGLIKDSELAGGRPSNPLTAVNPWAGIGRSMEYLGPELRS